MIGKHKQQVHKVSHWQQATIEITRCAHSLHTLVIMFNHSYVSIDTDYMPGSLYYCLFTAHMYLVWMLLFTQIQLHIEYNINREVATISPPFHNKPHQSHILCEGCTWDNFRILVTALFCCDWKACGARAQSFTMWQQATMEITRRTHSLRTLVITFNHSHVGIDRDYTPRSHYYCLFIPHIYGCHVSHRSWLW